MRLLISCCCCRAEDAAVSYRCMGLFLSLPLSLSLSQIDLAQSVGKWNGISLRSMHIKLERSSDSGWES